MQVLFQLFSFCTNTVCLDSTVYKTLCLHPVLYAWPGFSKTTHFCVLVQAQTGRPAKIRIQGIAYVFENRNETQRPFDERLDTEMRLRVPEQRRNVACHNKTKRLDTPKRLRVYSQKRNAPPQNKQIHQSDYNHSNHNKIKHKINYAFVFYLLYNEPSQSS